MIKIIVTLGLAAFISLGVSACQGDYNFYHVSPHELFRLMS